MIGIDILIPRNLTSLLIGKNGENIKRIQEASNANLHFSRD